MYGLVLGGGGTKGAYQIGAYKAINELQLEISGITGTSIGAINGAMFAQNEFQKAYDVWYNLSASNFFDVDEEQLKQLKELNINRNNFTYFAHKVKKILKNRGFDTSILRNFLNNNIDENKVRNSKMDFGLVTVSLNELKPLELFIEDIPEGKLIDYIMASANLPAFKPEKTDGKLFIDGGFYDNLPINLLASKGYKSIIAINLNGMGIVRKIERKDLNIIYINPSDDLGKTLNFDREYSRKNIKLGYFDTLKVFKDLKGHKYYIKSKNDEDYFVNILLKLSKEKVLNIGKILGFENIPYRRMLFEFIIPKFVELFNMKKDNDYEDIILRFYEEIAKKYNVERFKIYSFEEFVNETLSKYHSNVNKVSSSVDIPNFLKHNTLLAKVVKDKIIDEVINEILNIA